MEQLKRILTLVLAFCALQSYSQAPLFSGQKVDILTNVTFTDPYQVTGQTQSILNGMDATTIAVGDSVYLYDSGELRVYAVTALDSISGIDFTITIDDINDSGNIPATGEAAIYNNFGDHDFPSEISNLSDQLATAISNRFIQRLDEKIGDADSPVRDTITQAAHGFAVLAPVRQVAGIFVGADADVPLSAEGVVVDSIDANTFVLGRQGSFTVTAHGLSIDTTYYLDTAAGTFVAFSGRPTNEQQLFTPKDANTIVVHGSLLFIYTNVGSGVDNNGLYSSSDTIPSGTIATLEGNFQIPFNSGLPGITYSDFGVFETLTLGSDEAYMSIGATAGTDTVINLGSNVGNLEFNSNSITFNDNRVGTNKIGPTLSGYLDHNPSDSSFVTKKELDEATILPAGTEIQSTDAIPAGDSTATFQVFTDQGRDSFGIVVNSYTDIQNLSTTLVAGQRIKVRDTGAEYLVQTDSVAGYVTDGIGVISVGAFFARLDAKIYDPDWFGANSSDAISDRDAIQKCILYSSIRGGQVFFADNSGTYRIDSSDNSIVLYRNMIVDGNYAKIFFQGKSTNKVGFSLNSFDSNLIVRNMILYSERTFRHDDVDNTLNIFSGNVAFFQGKDVGTKSNLLIENIKMSEAGTGVTLNQGSNILLRNIETVSVLNPIAFNVCDKCIAEKIASDKRVFNLSDTKFHHFYVIDVNRNVFRDISMRGASGLSFKITSTDNTSKSLSIENLNLDSTGFMSIQRMDNVSILNLTLKNMENQSIGSPGVIQLTGKNGTISIENVYYEGKSSEPHSLQFLQSGTANETKRASVENVYFGNVFPIFNCNNFESIDFEHVYLDDFLPASTSLASMWSLGAGNDDTTKLVLNNIFLRVPNRAHDTNVSMLQIVNRSSNAKLDNIWVEKNSTSPFYVIDSRDTAAVFASGVYLSGSNLATLIRSDALLFEQGSYFSNIWNLTTTGIVQNAQWRAISLPARTTASRPIEPKTGDFAFNTTTNYLEYYNSDDWRQINPGAISDADNDTKIQVEKSADEDMIRFDAAGAEKMNLTANGLTVNTAFIDSTGSPGTNQQMPLSTGTGWYWGDFFGIDGTGGTNLLPYFTDTNTLAVNSNFALDGNRLTINSPSTSKFRVGYNGSIYTDFLTNSTGYYSVEPTGGRMGINTTTPGSTLEVQAEGANTQKALILNHGNSTMATGEELEIDFEYFNSDFARISAVKEPTGYGLKFYTGSSAVVNTTPIISAVGSNQLAINSTSAPDASAVLDVVSTTGGILFPRMTTTQRDAISSPTDGLVIYNTTTSKLQVRAGGAWVDLH